MRTRSDASVRPLVGLLAGSGLAVGLGLLTRAEAVTGAVDPRYPRGRLWIVRALGLRLVVQHALVLLRRDGTSLRLAAAVDGLHAASMVPALAAPRYRRAALLSGGLAAVSAVVAARLAGSERR